MGTMPPIIASTATALPSHRYGQHDLARIASRVFPEIGVEIPVLERFFHRVGVDQRFLALPVEEYEKLDGLGGRNDAWLRVAMELAERAVRTALGRAELPASGVSLMMTTTVTGLAVPSIGARLMNRIDLPPTMKRVPLFGLGCIAGVSGTARCAEYLRAFPDEAAVFLSVELCSLTMQRGDGSVANVISTGLFGDGAACVVLAGASHPLAKRSGPQVVDSLSFVFPDTERVMGWDVVDTGFKIVLDPSVPKIAREGLPDLVDGLLARNGIVRDDVGFWIAHPGGPAVMEAMREGLGLPKEALSRTKRSLAKVGNLSSASVLFLLDEVHREERPEPGTWALMIAMGPAFAAEAVLLRW